MTELREKVFSEVLTAINAHSYEGWECQQAGADNTTDAIMALIAGGSGEVIDIGSLASLCPELGAEAPEPCLFDVVKHYYKQAFDADEAGELAHDYLNALIAAYAIDRPAPVVVKDRMAILRKLSDVFHDHDPEHDDSDRAAEDTLNFIFSAVNAVSEAQVRADERERLILQSDAEAQEAEAKGFAGAAGFYRDRSEWLRAQEGGK